jgi:hypothetical protein
MKNIRVFDDFRKRITKRWVEMKDESLITCREYANEYGIEYQTFLQWVSEYNRYMKWKKNDGKV